MPTTMEDGVARQKKTARTNRLPTRVNAANITLTNNAQPRNAETIQMVSLNIKTCCTTHTKLHVLPLLAPCYT